MSKVTTENFLGADATIVGYVSGDARYPGYDKNGERGYMQVRIPINQGYKKDGEFVRRKAADGSDLVLWFTVEAHQDVIGGLKKGDKVRVEGAQLEAREFTRKDDSVGQEFLLTYPEITVLESADSDDDEAPF